VDLYRSTRRYNPEDHALHAGIQTVFESRVLMGLFGPKADEGIGGGGPVNVVCSPCDIDRVNQPEVRVRCGIIRLCAAL
jgi:hypothetical protein